MTADFREIAARLRDAFRLATRPLAVYGADARPEGIPPLTDVDRCFAVALHRMASGDGVSAIYVGADTAGGCCPGGLYHVGYVPAPDDIRYFVSTGRNDVRGGTAEYLKAGPELVGACTLAAGPIRPPGRYLSVQACDALPGSGPDVRSICCFGTGEQIRNMAALVHFDRADPFSPVIVPWGSACSTYITFPAGLAENAPRETAFMGPQGPTQNRALPPEMMALGIPAGVAERRGKTWTRRTSSDARRWRSPATGDGEAKGGSFLLPSESRDRFRPGRTAQRRSASR